MKMKNKRDKTVKELQKLADRFVKVVTKLHLTEVFEDGISSKSHSDGVILNSELGVSFQGDSKDDIKLVLVTMRIGSVIHKTKYFGYNKHKPEWEDI